MFPFLNIPGLFKAAVEPILSNAAAFQNAITTRGAGLSGAADGKKGIISAWVRIDAIPTGSPNNKTAVFCDNQDRFSFGKIEPTFGSHANEFALQIKDTANTIRLLLYSSSAFPNGTGAYRHVLASWDVGASNARHLYIDDALDMVVNTFSDGTLDYTDTNWAVGSNPGGSDRLGGVIAELYVNLAEYLDLSEIGNRRKFITSDRRPVGLGPTGALPTGNQPLVYLSLDKDGAKSTFLTNKGSGGNFSEATNIINVSVGNPTLAPTRMDAADFDGTNDYMTRGAGLSGIADSKLFTWVGWFRLDGGDGVQQRFMGSSTALGGAVDRLRVQRSAAGIIFVSCNNAAGTQILSIGSTDTFLAGGGWKCLMCSVDMADTAKRHLYVGDTNILQSVATYTDDTLDLTVADWSIGGNPDGNAKVDGALADIHFYPGVYVDLSVEANRRKFYSALGKPVDTGVDGSIPTGVAATVLSRVHSGEAVANFATNRGTGGNFTITGTLTTASSSPSS